MKVKIAYRELSKITPHPTNPRVITEEAMANLCQSISEDPLYFETRPIICSDRTGKLVIIAGEKRYLAAIRLGMEKAPIAVLSNLTEEDEQRILIKDNGSFGDWDWDKFREWGFDNLPHEQWGVQSPFLEGMEDIHDTGNYNLNEPQSQKETQDKEGMVKCPACGYEFSKH